VTRGRAAVLSAAAAAVTVIAAVGVACAIDVQITIVRAAAHGPSDAELIPIRPRLRRLVGYRSFQVVQTERRRCPWQSQQAFVLPGGRLMRVVPKGMRDKAVVMQVKLVDGPRELVDTDVRLQNRGMMVFGVDEDPNRPGALLIMVRAVEKPGR
jgi:hypothetical protein